jgi:hypothetical protein
MEDWNITQAERCAYFLCAHQHMHINVHTNICNKCAHQHMHINVLTNICNKCAHQHFTYRGADKSLARPTSRCILFDGENISIDASLVILVILGILVLYI